MSRAASAVLILIAAAVLIPRVRSRDVAPTVAETLGLTMDSVEGAVLDRALT